MPTNLRFDALAFNSHRIYGPLRYPLLTANFRVVDYFTAQEGIAVPHAARTEGRQLPLSQPVVVLQKVAA